MKKMYEQNAILVKHNPSDFQERETKIPIHLISEDESGIVARELWENGKVSVPMSFSKRYYSVEVIS